MANYNPGRDPNLPARVRRALRRAGRASLHLSQGLTSVESVASATTVNLNYTTGELVLITGSVKITGFEVAAEGEWRYVTFDNTLILVHNATSFILPGDNPIATVAGDSADFVSLGEGNWKCTKYERGGTPPSPQYNSHYADAATSAAIGTHVYDNGASGAGATITFTGLAAAAIDGVLVFAGMSILVKNEGFGNQSAKNGLYDVTVVGIFPTVNEVWTRSAAMDTSNKYVGAVVYVISGTANSNNLFAYLSGLAGLGSSTPPTVGTTQFGFTRISPILSGVGAPGATTGYVGAIYFDVQSPTDPQFYFKE